MADNIKIVGNITSTTQVSRYSQKDLQLIPQKEVQSKFGGNNDYIEYFVYDVVGNLLNIDYNYLKYKLPSNYNLSPTNNQTPNTTGNIQTEGIGVVSTLSSNTGSLYPIIEIDPISDLQSLGYSSGEFNIRYNLFQNKISDVDNAALFIKEISQDRTEVRLASFTLSDSEIESSANSLIEEISKATYHVDYLLNFGNNIQVLAINIALNKAPNGYELLFKLYQPLPINIQEKDNLWVVSEKVEPYVFDINLDKLLISAPSPKLRGPNFDISVPNQGTISTEYNNYSNLVNNLQSLQSSSYNQILNLINEKGIDINVDYTEYNNFVFFSSANKRLSNFYYKVQQIENYNNLINTYSPYVATTSSLQTEINSYSSSINNIITQFDGYEYYLYFESSSYSWPKSGFNKPYSLLSTGSAAVITWYNSTTGSAIDYDDNNYDNLEYVIPAFIKDDENNESFLTFLNMIGHYFDNIWIYLKAITDINKANNNLELGISKDLVYNQLQSLGIKLYNSQAGEQVDKFLIGSNTGSAYYSGSLNDFSPTSSYLNNIPRKDLLSELYKRIYHNLPLLLKTKGTVAGLEYLISTFGIPSKTYITGSVISGSILNVKEFGGSTKNILINGYNNDKVRIINNSITGSVLSSMLSLQTFPTASSQFRDNDLNYIDISFSPETQMDNYISGSISSNNPTWSLDNYIGDPRQLYSSSYNDLNTQRSLYYENGVSGHPGFTGSLLDYNGFIRLIQFFDNALFKMLGDFVPERTSLSTGVTINSPLLERNKVPYLVPLANTQSVYTAEYQTSSIDGQYDHNYVILTGDKKPFFTGEFSGSIVDVNQYYDEYNPYLQPTSSLTSGDLNTFNHSDYNVLLNNVSSSVRSQFRHGIEYIYGTTSSIVIPVELQDSYLTLTSYDNSRYQGSKVTSLLYNTYTSASSDYIGDKSFGKTAAVDNYSRKIGLFTQIETSSFLPKRTNVSLKYLVDEKGNLTELNQLNKHWEDIQRTFVSGKYANISLFDNKKYSNQKSTDGNKNIFDSGYSYYPILYFSSCSVDPAIAFENGVIGTSYSSRALNSLSTGSYTSGSITYSYISGSSVMGYPISQSYVSKLFDQVIQGGTYLIGGSSGSSPLYSVQETGNHSVYATFNFKLELPQTPVNEATWSLRMYKSSSLGVVLIAEDRHYYGAGDPANATLTFTQYNDGTFTFNLSQAIPSSDITINYVNINAYTSSVCVGSSDDSDTLTTAVIMYAGSTSVSGTGANPIGCGPIQKYKRSNSMTVNGVTYHHGDAFAVGGTMVTCSIDYVTCEFIC